MGRAGWGIMEVRAAFSTLVVVLEMMEDASNCDMLCCVVLLKNE